MLKSEPALTFEDGVRRRLKTLAINASREGTLEKFADIIGVHPTTLSTWMTAGNVPAFRARRLQDLYGVENAPADQLSKEIAEQNNL